MTKEQMQAQLAQEKLLPLYTTHDMNLVAQAEEILLNNGLHFIEVTYRSALADQTIRQLSSAGKLIVGAGTVRNLKDCKRALDNGAQFIVSPGFSEEVVSHCVDNDVPVFPGVATPTEITRALDYGLKVVKFFPASVYGGLKAIKALSAPFFDVKFIPTGGVNQENYQEYLANDAVLAVGGSFILSEKDIALDGGRQAAAKLKDLVAGI